MRVFCECVLVVSTHTLSTFDININVFISNDAPTRANSQILDIFIDNIDSFRWVTCVCMCKVCATVYLFIDFSQFIRSRAENLSQSFTTGACVNTTNDVSSAFALAQRCRIQTHTHPLHASIWSHRECISRRVVDTIYFTFQNLSARLKVRSGGINLHSKLTITCRQVFVGASQMASGKKSGGETNPWSGVKLRCKAHKELNISIWTTTRISPEKIEENKYNYFPYEIVQVWFSVAPWVES